MSDVIKKPVAGMAKTSADGKDADSTWKLLLGFFCSIKFGLSDLAS
ncbi:hypothetical protein [Psychrobacter sp. JCM 18900]|nr:hypothetical protein [Psychrobacter sp. JCM 18900]